MKQNNDFILAFLACPYGQLPKNEKILRKRLSAFLSLLIENSQAAQELCSEKNVQKDIRLTANNFLDQEPFEVFSPTRIELIAQFKQEAEIKAAAREELSKKRTAISGVAPESIDALVSLLSGDIAYLEQVIMYLMLYPLIIKHPGE